MTYYYVLNLQGDVVKLVEHKRSLRVYSLTTVANYTYNAWGEILSITDADGNAITDTTNIAHVNPLRYRGYYYDAETGFYYLQSRYYDPVMHRFINADSYQSTGQGVIGTNMFAYCLNSPIAFCDSTGYYANDGSAITITEMVIEAIKETLLSTVSATVTVAVEIAAPIVLVGSALLSLIYGTKLYFEDGVSCDGENTKSASDYLEPEAERVETLDVLALRYERFRCKEAAEALQLELLRNNQHGQLITIQYSGIGRHNNVWSDSRGDVISKNGFHCGIEFNGIVYCNIHPFGLSEAAWLNDFRGFGERKVSRIPF